MNYYERHLGDYAKDTGHLSMLEHGAYNLLLDRYYGTEGGIPADQVYRVARAKTKEEREAVDLVLAEFFELIDGSWIKGRCEEEIARYRERIAEVDTRHENERERQQRTRERRKTICAALRDRGITPKWNMPLHELEALLSRAAAVTSHAPVTPPVTVTGTNRSRPLSRDLHAPATASQSPVSSPQTPEVGIQSSSPDISPANITVVAPSLTLDAPPNGAEQKVSKGAKRPSKRMPPEYQAGELVRAWAREKAPLVDFETELAACRDYEFKHARSDWDAVLRTWLLREQKDLARRERPNGAKSSYLTRFEARKRALENA